jgi:hypothetical protein
MKSKFKAPGTKRLKQEYDFRLSSLAYSFNLRRYIVAERARADAAVAKSRVSAMSAADHGLRAASAVRRCILNCVDTDVIRWFQRLKRTCDTMLSIFAFNYNLRLYSPEEAAAAAEDAAAAAADRRAAGVRDEEAATLAAVRKELATSQEQLALMRMLMVDADVGVADSDWNDARSGRSVSSGGGLSTSRRGSGGVDSLGGGGGGAGDVGELRRRLLERDDDVAHLTEALDHMQRGGGGAAAAAGSTMESLNAKLAAERSAHRSTQLRLQSLEAASAAAAPVAKGTTASSSIHWRRGKTAAGIMSKQSETGGAGVGMAEVIELAEEMTVSVAVRRCKLNRCHPC